MTSVASASFALILHAHLPFVRHPEHENFLEEDWLFEAITETYLPLLRLMRRLVDDGRRLQADDVAQPYPLRDAPRRAAPGALHSGTLSD